MRRNGKRQQTQGPSDAEVVSTLRTALFERNAAAHARFYHVDGVCYCFGCRTPGHDLTPWLAQFLTLPIDSPAR